MTLHQMRIFHTIVEQQGFAAAGETLLLSQPSISCQLKSLEKSLGLILIDREQSAQANGIVLTVDGRYVLEVTRRILSEYEHLSEYSKHRDTFSMIRIVTNSTIGSYLLPKLISDFHATNPEIKINLTTESDFNQLIKTCKGAFYDLCIAPLNKNTLSNINVFYSFKMPIVLVTANEDYSIKTKVSLNDLSSLPLILPSLNSVARKALTSVLPQLLENKSSIEVDHSESMKRMLLSNKKYFALLSSIAIIDETKTGPLYIIHTDPPLPSIDYRIFQIRKPLHLDAKHFLGHLVNHLSLE